MRLREIAARLAAIALACLAATDAGAEDRRAGAWISVYQSSDRVTVVSPQITARSKVGERFDVEAGYDVDVISAASVDLVTAASPQGYTEVRQGLTLGGAFRPEPGTRVGVRWLPSWEPDYQSQTATASLSRDWIDRRLTTELALRGAVDEVGRRGAPRDSWRSLQSLALQPAVAWVFGPRTVGQIAYELSLLDGFQASPYRFVPIAFAGAGTSGVSEAVPDRRARHAASVGLRQAITRRWFASTSLRAYADTWGIWSTTEDAQLEYALPGDRATIGVEARVYGQSAASFYAPRYVAQLGELPLYRTMDKLLVRQWSGLGALRGTLRWEYLGPLDALTVTAKIELYEERFLDYTPLGWRTSVIPSLGASAEF